tara:strand:+ start:22 stop:474 length:453 start_codon:yes stop_codon:yes gene_type:complete
VAMIGAAIYELLNVASVTNLVNDISPMIARSGIDAPYIVFNESGIPENFKNGYSVVNYDLRIDAYAKKGRDNSGGKANLVNIYNAVEAILNRYTGIVAGVRIGQIYQQSQEIRYDEMSESARLTIEYKVRVNTDAIPVAVFGDTFDFTFN